MRNVKENLDMSLTQDIGTSMETITAAMVQISILSPKTLLITPYIFEEIKEVKEIPNVNYVAAIMKSKAYLPFCPSTLYAISE